MAVAIRNTYQSASWFQASAGSITATGVSWEAGDVIVVLAGQENASATFTGCTATGLTFTARQVTAGTGSGNPYARGWTAKAASAGSGVTVTVTRSGGTLRGGFIVYVLSGADDYVTGASSATEALMNLTVGADAWVGTLTVDWNAINFTAAAAAGSGTGTVRVDVNDTSYAGHYVCDWVGTSAGTFGFGLNSYAGLAVEQIAIAVSAAAGGTTVNPAAVARSSTVPAPTPTASSIPTPAAVGRTSTVGAPTPSSSAAAAPATVAAGAGFGSPTPTAGATAAPDALAAAGTVSAATPAATAVPTPAAVEATSTVGAATPTVDRTAAPDAFAATGTVPTPSVSTSSDATATPAAFAASVAVGTPTPTDAVTASPAAVSASPSVGSPTATADSSVAVSAVAVGSTLPAPTADTGGTIAAPASVAGTAVVRTDFAADNKWASIVNDFDYPLTDNFLTSGVAPTYIGNKVRWDMGGSDGAIRDFVDRDLTGSYVSLLVEPNPSYGYVEFQITRSSGATIVGSAYKLATTNVINIFYNGSVRATPTWDAIAMAYWRWREAGGTLHFETSPDGAVWTSRWSDASAGATFDLTTIEVVVNGGGSVGGTAPSTGSEYAYVSKFNILPPSSTANPTAVVGTGAVGAASPAFDGALSTTAVAVAATVPNAGVSVEGPLTVAPGAVGAAGVVSAPNPLAAVTPAPAAVESAAVVPLPGAEVSNKWDAVTCNFDDFAGDIFDYGGSINPSTSYSGNRCRFNMQSGVDGNIRDRTDRDLTDSHVLLRAEPNTSYGYLELQLTQGNGATLVASAYTLANNGLLHVYYNGALRTSFAYNATTHAWWRWREASGTLSFETSANGWAWTERWSEPTAGATFDLTVTEVQINGGGVAGGGAPDGTSFAYVSRFNLPEAVPDTATPDAVAGPAVVPLPTAGESATAGATVVGASGVVPWSASGGQVNLTLIQDQPLAFPVVVGTASVAIPSVTPTPGAVGAVAGVGAPAVVAPLTATPAVVDAASDVPTPVPTAGTTTAPGSVTGSGAVASPSITADASPVAVAVAAPATVPLATTPGSAIAAAPTISGVAVVNLATGDAEDGPGIGAIVLGEVHQRIALGSNLTRVDLDAIYEGE